MIECVIFKLANKIVIDGAYVLIQVQRHGDKSKWMRAVKVDTGRENCTGLLHNHFHLFTLTCYINQACLAVRCVCAC